MIFINDYLLLISLIESYIKDNKLDGTELASLNRHKFEFEQDFNYMIECKERWDKVEEYLRKLNQAEE